MAGRRFDEEPSNSDLSLTSLSLSSAPFESSDLINVEHFSRTRSGTLPPRSLEAGLSGLSNSAFVSAFCLGLVGARLTALPANKLKSGNSRFLSFLESLRSAPKSISAALDWFASILSRGSAHLVVTGAVSSKHFWRHCERSLELQYSLTVTMHPLAGPTVSSTRPNYMV